MNAGRDRTPRHGEEEEPAKAREKEPLGIQEENRDASSEQAKNVFQGGSEQLCVRRCQKAKYNKAQEPSYGSSNTEATGDPTVG